MGGPKSGFASMDPAKRREICAAGGRRAHALGVAHEFTTEEAKQAGKIGGLATGGQTPKGQDHATRLRGRRADRLSGLLSLLRSSVRALETVGDVWNDDGERGRVLRELGLLRRHASTAHSLLRRAD